MGLGIMSIMQLIVTGQNISLFRPELSLYANPNHKQAVAVSHELRSQVQKLGFRSPVLPNPVHLPKTWGFWAATTIPLGELGTIERQELEYMGPWD